MDDCFTSLSLWVFSHWVQNSCFCMAGDLLDCVFFSRRMLNSSLDTTVFCCTKNYALGLRLKSTSLYEELSCMISRMSSLFYTAHASEDASIKFMEGWSLHMFPCYRFINRKNKWGQLIISWTARKRGYSHMASHSIHCLENKVLLRLNLNSKSLKFLPTSFPGLSQCNQWVT